MSASVSSNSADLSIQFDSEKETDVVLNLNSTTNNSTSNSVSDISKTEIVNNNSSVETVTPTQLTQWVYIQTPTKVALSNNASSNNKNNSNNLMVNGTLPQFQLSNLGSGINNKNTILPSSIQIPTNITIPTNQGVLLTQPLHNSIKPHLVIKKSPGNIQAVPVVPVSVATSTGSKSALVHFTMIKSNDSAQLQQFGGLGKIKTTDNLQIVSSSHLSSSISNSSLTNQKYVIAPMPKVTSNRLPITATTNTVQPKIAFMPIGTLNSSKPKTFNFKLTDGQLKERNNGKLPLWAETLPGNKQKMYNFKIADGLLQNDNNGNIKILCSSSGDKDTENSDRINQPENEKLLCSEIICLNSPEKKESPEERFYELSIVENSNSCKSDVNLTITPVLDDPEKCRGFENNKFPQKETQKFVKHGVSILKKNFANVDRKSEKNSNSLIISPMPNTITTVSDAISKEIKVLSTSKENTDVFLAKSLPLRTERRRKSNFSYRVDYDDAMTSSNANNWKKSKISLDRYKQFENSDIMLTKLDDDNNYDIKKEIKTEDMIEIELIKEEKVDEPKENCDIFKILKWEDGIGTLPGSELKFHMNEYGMLEYLTKEEFKQLLSSKKPEQLDQKPKKESQEDICCAECGCYGLRSDFVTSKYCSYDCQENGMKHYKVKRKKKKTWTKKTSNEYLGNNDNGDVDQSPSEEENTSNENSIDKYNYPWNCSKKGFSWSKYLDHIKAKAAPVKLFKDPFPYTRNGFRPGMKLEGIDPQHPSHFCVLTVAEVVGYRMRLYFDGYPENYDFWVNADSMDIFPAGWCEKNGHVLHLPPTYTTEDFNWNTYLKQTRSTAAPKHLFVNRAGSSVCPNGFRIGMKLEAVDRKNTSLICVATVADMMDNRLLIHFDNWNDIYDYWADPTSPYIHPVGWCDQYGHNLTPPSGYPNPETFTWEKYLKETKSTPAPVRAFKQRPACGFKRSMRLEAVDKRVPQLIRVATVDDVREHQIRIRFDGWPDRYNFWIDDDSTDIHPVGWCQKTGHPIEPPLTPDDVYDFLECPTVGCRGVGHIRGPKYPTHSSQNDCPYAEENIDKENILPDRLLTPDCQVEAVVPVSVPVSKEIKDKSPIERQKPRIGRPPKIPRMDTHNIKTEWNESDDSKPPKRKYPKRCKTESPPGGFSVPKRDGLIIKNGFVQPPPPDPTWFKHANYLRQFIRQDADPRDWSVDDVADFISSLPSCNEEHLALFDAHHIDGEALLMLTQQDLTNILNIKLGPAIKLYNAILLLRRNIFAV
ncbi:lethal(3)malignant brain tumor-like protein 3 isoform X3 [Agrilus planipennis]|uniref:Lethal(3)malignant brain tumor-like protein 3 isoform X2 n=1 Tax=Agrilus planipennis TaxID=224129 RepID=A0A7F5RNJ7_AGRPL|nr:lethal(3)malignant brain tumor-like protein 3 isoform X2 [Agrilus planipennis]XP_025837599.1 lethal(3)malignant brain tumor-like protein 3 isoform X3 [Agrilus planipennis]